MKNLKKVASVVLALVMTLALMVPAFADGDEYSITVTNPQAGSTYEFYKLFDMTENGDNHSYSATEKWAPFFAEGAAGAAFISEDATDYLISVNKADKYLNLSDIAAFANAARAYALNTASVTPDETGSVENDGDALTKTFASGGYYMVFAKDASQNIESTASMCILTNTNSTQEIKIKSEKPTIDKTADNGASAVVKGVGDTVEFTINGKVPDTTGYTSYTYKITDTMSVGLTLNEDVTVTVGGNTISVTPIYADNGFELTLSKDDLGTTVGAAIVVTYTAEVNANAIERDHENNTAKLTYSNDPSDPTVNGTDETTETVVTIYDVQIDVDKYALNANDTNDTSNKLGGAQFALKNADGKYYSYTAANGEAPASLEWVDDVADATIAISGEDGKLDTAFKGLSPNTAYTLEEVEAPAGYNKAADIPVNVAPVTGNDNKAEGTTENDWVKVSETTEDGVTTITYLNTVSLNHVESVMNSTGAELPETGGIGTTIFYTMGALLVVSAGILLVVKKRMAM